MTKFKNKFKIICIAVVIFAIVCLTGCTGQTLTLSTSNPSSTGSSGSFEFTPEAVLSTSKPTLIGMEELFTDDFFIYYKDVTTDVMYVLYCGINEGGLTVMMDPETGKPLTHTNWLKYQSEVPPATIAGE